MKANETVKSLWTSTSARLLSAFILVAPCAVGLSACGEEETAKPGVQDAGDLCGNGAIEGVEVCDGAALPEGAPEGAICNADCMGWSVDAPAECGNGEIEGAEVCDGAALPEDAPATAKCKADCSGLEACGDGAIDEGEECDPGAALPEGTEEGSVCLDSCEIKGPNCGNGAIDEGEECDPEADLPAAYPASAVCLESCKIQFCGNGRIDGDEMCDGTTLPEGTPAGVVCEDDCTIKACGNGAIDEGEECDPFAAMPETLNGDPVATGSTCTSECKIDQCPEDDGKLAPGLCGCGTADDKQNTGDLDGDGVIACLDACPDDEWKTGAAGEDDCKCGETEVDGDCYLNINTAQDFLDLASGADAILKRDIDLGAALSAVDGAIEWQGIGTGADSRAYAGRFLGNGKRIFCTDGDGARLALKCASRRCGLFAQVDGALIQDLWLDLDVEAAFADKQEDEFAGLLAGEARGGSTLSNVHATGTLLATQGNASVLRAGGLVGELSTSAMFDATAEVEVGVRAADDGDAIYLGGLVGLIDGAQPYDLGAMGDVTLIGVAKGFVGGLAGAIGADGASSGARLTNAYALGAVAVRTGELAGETIREGAIGGLVGALRSDSALANAYALGTVSGRGSDDVGAVIGSPAASSTTARLYFWDHDGMTPAPACAGAGVADCTKLVASTTAGVTGLFVVDKDGVQTPLDSLLNGYLGPDVASQIGCARDEGDDPTFCAVGGTGPRYRLWENEVRSLGEGDYRLPTLKGL